MKFVLISLVIISLGVVSLFHELYVEDESYEYSFTDYVNPEERFVLCSSNDDCFKFKGSVCPAEAGGVETCINKNFVQEYSSVIEDNAGACTVNECPQICLTTNRTCECIDNRCVLTGELK
jgi:hypothetical protein